LTGCGPVAPQHLAVFIVGVAIRQSLLSWTTIGIFLRLIDKVLLTPAWFGAIRVLGAALLLAMPTPAGLSVAGQRMLARSIWRSWFGSLTLSTTL